MLARKNLSSSNPCVINIQGDLIQFSYDKFMYHHDKQKETQVFCKTANQPHDNQDWIANDSKL